MPAIQYHQTAEYVPSFSQQPTVQVKKEFTEVTRLIGASSFELNRDPFKWSRRIGGLLVVTNFFYIVYISLMVVVATLVLELHSDNISVSQQQNYHFPTFHRAIEVSSIVCAALLTFGLSLGITSNLSDCISPKASLVLSWIHFIMVLPLGPGLTVLSAYYFLILADSWMTIFFLTILGTFVVLNIILALSRVVALMMEMRARKIELKYEQTLVRSEA
jgi:hypothetical protein